MSISKTERLICQEYNRLAPIYDTRWHSYINSSLSFLLEFADIPQHASILDLACGTGELARSILKTNPQQNITGVDLSGAMLEIAQQKMQVYPQVQLFQASVMALPFNHQSFDLVICANAFHHFEFPQIALVEVKRVLKPNGILIILDWCRDYFWLKIGDCLLKLIDPTYQKCYSQSELEQLLINASFNLVKDSKVRLGFIWELLAITAISA